MKKETTVSVRISADMKSKIRAIAHREARSVSQVCEVFLKLGVEYYDKEGPKFLQRSIGRQKSTGKGAD
jgi:hypothetical protein